MNIIFFGSDDFAQEHLKALLASSHKVVACVTQPDRPKGRGMKVVDSPIKESAQAKAIDVLQPTTVKDSAFVSALKKYEADVFVVIAYGQILTQQILDLPKVCAVNVHGSLLPKYRGAAPINWAIINGETKTGLTIIRMNEKLDAGGILAVKEIEIKPEDTSEMVRYKMMREGPGFLVDTLSALSTLKAVAQDESAVTFAPKLTKETALIDWKEPAEKIHNLVRGLLPWPVAYTYYQNKALKIFSSHLVDRKEKAAAGAVVELNTQGILVQAKDACVLIREVQFESSKRMDAASFARGQRMTVGDTFLC